MLILALTLVVILVRVLVTVLVRVLIVKFVVILERVLVRVLVQEDPEPVNGARARPGTVTTAQPQRVRFLSKLIL